ncbi:class I SAM-dependent methyltransferase [Streptacidiphilus sp. N1-3]|uniref:Class I SAM-dependent methyltransferase n=1 Tax=Streptacidiphilus alkalitolerans TaxID=3342712 RepID=A0ABV6X1G5_9ACTN
MGQIVNTEQAQAWNGYEGIQWARSQSRWDAVNEGFNAPLLGAAAIGADATVLDVGCGAGRTTRLAARQAVHGRALGLDLSLPMLERARATTRQEGIRNVAFEHGDAQVHPLAPGAFDTVISRFGVMFFADPVAAFGNLARALRPGGRMAFICGADAERNQWIEVLAVLRPFLPANDFGAPGSAGMFSLADPGRIHDVLSAAGLAAVSVERVEADGTWGQDADDAAAFMLDTGPGHHLAATLEPDARNRARLALTEALRDHEVRQQEGGHTVRLRGTGWLVTADRPR